MASYVYKTVFQVKRGQSDAWASVNPILHVGEPGFEIDTNRLKIGDGKTPWNELKYLHEGQGGDAIVNRKTHYDFPSVGSENVIYKASEEKKLYQWDPATLTYVLLSEGSSPLEEVKLIHGGNANVTNNS